MTQEKHIFQGEQPTEAENRKEVPTAGSYIPSLVPIPSLEIDRIKIDFHTTNIDNQQPQEIDRKSTEQIQAATGLFAKEIDQL